MINIKPSHRGLLHKELKVPMGKKIPEAKLEKAERSSSPAERKRAAFAESSKGWDHSGNHAAKTRRRVGP